MSKKKVYVETWGCQLNYHRSEALTAELERSGYQPVSELGDADLILFNTCAVRGRSEEKVKGRIGQIKEERKKGSLLGVGGCMAQHSGKELLSDAAGVDFVFGTGNLTEVPKLAAQTRKGLSPVSTPSPAHFEDLTYNRNSDYFAWVTIADGCSNSCSYCIVPQVRGSLRSRPLEEVLEEVDELVQEGYKEIQLLGQNVNAYGKDLNESEATFAHLLEQVDLLGPPRLSFTTPHPADLNEETLGVLEDASNVVRHIHLPLQSGSDKVLEIMNRNYMANDYLNLVNQIRAMDPLINITTDIIVGHPGETEEDFRQTLNLIRKVDFGSIYAAKFSPRPGTRSAKLEDQVPQKVKEERLEKLLTLQKNRVKDVNRNYIGEHSEVLVEGTARKNGNMYGKNEFYKTVVFDGGPDLVGQMVEVTIRDVEEGTLYAERED